jgi:hypothetical protein
MAIEALARAPIARREQQARRLADLFGDAIALATITLEADDEARTGDYRKALTVELFAARRAQPADPVATITHGWAGVADLYPALFAEDPLAAEGYGQATMLLATT